MISTSKSPDRKTENGVAAQLPEPSEREQKANGTGNRPTRQEIPARGWRIAPTKSRQK